MAKRIMVRCPKCHHEFEVDRNFKRSILKVISKEGHTAKYIAGQLGMTRVGVLWWIKRLRRDRLVTRSFREGKYFYRRA